VLEVADENPVLGVGYGGYWGLVPGSYYKHYQVKQSHNGYIEVYLNVGLVGIAALIFFIFEFSGNITRIFYYYFETGILGICVIMTILLYNYSEGAYFESNLMWTLPVYLSVAFSGSPARDD